ncbi:MAG: 2OG-Fe(II) oxygenase [Bdellovibrio sp.]|nr:2OG-Fe(II) oxygenase [Bdellovibrio sp.]
MLQTNYLHENFELIDSQGWARFEIPRDFCKALLSTAQNRFRNQEFRDATVAEAVSNSTILPNEMRAIRSDMTCWVTDKSEEPTEVQLLFFLENIKSELSQYFRFGLTHFECHYAVYQPNKFYKRHSDQTKQNNHRFFSFVIYLNENWRPDYGGHLCGYRDEKVIFEIEPTLGTMVIFKSDLEHEVRPATQARWSLTGWFRK